MAGWGDQAWGTSPWGGDNAMPSNSSTHVWVPQVVGGVGVVVDLRSGASAPSAPSGGGGGGEPEPPSTGEATLRFMKAPSRSGLPWYSGVWCGAPFTAARLDAWGSMRSRLTDSCMAYANYQQTGEAGLMNSGWNASWMNPFAGRLVYGMCMVPSGGAWGVTEAASGSKNYVYTKMAQDLLAAGNGDAVIRVTWEANGGWYPWSVTYANRENWKAAFRHMVSSCRAVSPNFVYVFEVACGSGLAGGPNKLSALTDCYPGDEWVDLIGGDTYDFYDTRANNLTEFQQHVMVTNNGPGIQDVVDFARAHNKGVIFPEWGCHGNTTPTSQGGPGGGGDNPAYVNLMYDFFAANADVLVGELYFSESDTYIRNSLNDPTQLANSRTAYIAEWSAGVLPPSGTGGGGGTEPPAGGGTIIFSDNYTGTDGAAWGSYWTTGYTGTGASATISGNKGRLATGATAGAAYTNNVARRYTGTLADFDVTFTVTFTGEGYLSAGFRGDNSSIDFGNGYYLEVQPDRIQIVKVANWNYTVPQTVSRTHTTGVAWKVRLYAKGSALKAKSWLASGAEPGTWDLQVTDAAYATGVFGLAFNKGAAASASVALFDDLIASTAV